MVVFNTTFSVIPKQLNNYCHALHLDIRRVKVKMTWPRNKHSF